MAGGGRLARGAVRALTATVAARRAFIYTYICICVYICIYVLRQIHVLRRPVHLLA